MTRPVYTGNGHHNRRRDRVRARVIRAARKGASI